MPQLKKVEPNDAPDRGDVIAGRGDPAPSMRLKTSERLPFTLHQGAADEAADVRTDAEPAAQPFVKWVGGKRSLVNAIKPLLPPKFGEYYELLSAAARSSSHWRIAPDTLTYGIVTLNSY